MEITLIPASSQLLEAHYEFYLDSETRRYDPFPAPTLDSLKVRIANANSRLSDFQTARSFFWFLKRGDEVVAQVSLNNLNPMMMTAEIGFGVFPASRGQGIATASIRLVTQKVFSESPVRKLIALVHENNYRSRKALETAGYHQEGLLRESYILNGSPANEAIYGILRNEILLGQDWLTRHCAGRPANPSAPKY